MQMRTFKESLIKWSIRLSCVAIWLFIIYAVSMYDPKPERYFTLSTKFNRDKVSIVKYVRINNNVKIILKDSNEELIVLELKETNECK